MAETWLEGVGQNGIAATFAVNRHGVLPWVGRPMELQDEWLESMLNDTYDMPKGRAAFLQRVEMRELLRSLNRSKATYDWMTVFETLAVGWRIRSGRPW